MTDRALSSGQEQKQEPELSHIVMVHHLPSLDQRNQASYLPNNNLILEEVL